MGTCRCRMRLGSCGSVSVTEVQQTFRDLQHPSPWRYLTHGAQMCRYSYAERGRQAEACYQRACTVVWGLPVSLAVREPTETESRNVLILLRCSCRKLVAQEVPLCLGPSFRTLSSFSRLSGFLWQIDRYIYLFQMLSPETAYRLHTLLWKVFTEVVPD